MKIRNFFYLAMAVITVLSSCKKDDEKNDDPKYPAGAIVWPKDTVVTLSNHYIVAKGASLFIEEGVEIILDDTVKRPEFVVLGNLYCMGTAAKPIKFSCAVAYRTEEKRFNRYWGGIICGYESQEVLLDNVIVEFGGAQTTEESASFQNQLFKTETGEGVPGFHFCNKDGRFVIQNCTFRNNAEDQIYITGGKSIVTNNKFIASGFDGGEAINYKSDCLADVCYNLVYDANSNALKLSNSGFVALQSEIIAYNNTVVNTGWRRPKKKGGSIWLEETINAKLYNNLMFDCRWACKTDVGNPYDSIKSVITPNYYFASTETGVTQYTPSAVDGILRGASDIFSATAGDKNPNFESFTIQSNIDINVGTTKSGNIPQTFASSMDFHLKNGSPALTGGKTDFTRHFASTGIVINGKAYTSPAPAAHFGAYGLK